jgi:helix-turn-helix protein
VLAKTEELPDHPPADTSSPATPVRTRRGVRRRADRPLSALSQTDPLPSWLWHEPPMIRALAERDMAAVFGLLQEYGLSQRSIAARTGQSQSEISEVISGRRIVSYDVLVRIADGLAVCRGYLGLAYYAPIPYQRPGPD